MNHAMCRRNMALKGNKMGRSLTGCRLLLVAPSFLLMMQVALALHQQHSKSLHDDKDSLLSFSADFYPEHIKLDVLSFVSLSVIESTSNCLMGRNPDNHITPITILCVDPSQSRAPPSILLS